MSKCKLLTLLFLLGSILSACGPGQLFGPTFTPTASFTPTSTATLTPTLTPTATNTPVPTATSTPLPGLGITDSELVSWAEDFDYVLNETTIDGLPARKYVSPEGYTTLILVGEPPYLEKVILEIDMVRENSTMATLTWIYVLEIASNYAGKPAADWVHDNYPKAARSGREEKVFKDANIILEAEGSIFRLIIEPAVK
ncbi:MAG: hypothetical protein JW730_03310 [Anaerolineales bacterium]|nr:hypothetical protein [Anaerolineales bacterium]